MPRAEFGALLFWIEVAAVVVTALLLKRWMLPPPHFGGRYWRSLLACLTSLPITAVAIFVTAIAVGYPADQSYSPGGVAGQFLAGSFARSVILWPLVVAWFVIKPRGLSPVAATPLPPAQPIPQPTLLSSNEPARGNKAPFFRNWKNPFGLLELEGIEALSDQRVNEIYTEDRDELQAIASKKPPLSR